tara:strand:+ start:731 stop:1165 length:435 start_codon:yes stop_codon:yes gene_type:complete
MGNKGFYYFRMGVAVKFFPTEPQRSFRVGIDKKIKVKDCASIQLEAEEQVTFVTESGAEYDVARKKWGFYATPSLNGRLSSFALRAVLVKNSFNKYFIFLVEKGKEKDFQEYLNAEEHIIISWMDNDSFLEIIETKLRGLNKEL